MHNVALKSGLIHIAEKIILCRVGCCPNQLKSIYEFYLNKTPLRMLITGDTDCRILKFQIVFVTCTINRSYAMPQSFSITQS